MMSETLLLAVTSRREMGTGIWHIVLSRLGGSMDDTIPPWRLKGL